MSMTHDPHLARSTPAPAAPSRPAQQSVPITGGLAVYSRDGELLGQVGKFVIDAAGNLTSFVVNTGDAFGDEPHVLMDWIQSSTHEQIQLRITAAEVRLASRKPTAGIMKRRRQRVAANRSQPRKRRPIKVDGLA